jgi:hypothetical protein
MWDLAGRAAGLGACLLVELVLLWRIAVILLSGAFNIDLLFWTTWRSGLDVIADRSQEPILYWTATFALFVMAFVTAGVFAAIWRHG